MRQLLLIASVVGLIMYAGFASQNGSVQAVVHSATGAPSLGALQRCFDATGGALQKVQITGWVEAESKDALSLVNDRLGWTPGLNVPQELREARLHDRDGHQFVAVRWILTGTAAATWQSSYNRLDQTLGAVGKGQAITVQLEGTTPKKHPLALATRALDAVGAVERQPWSDAFAASIAGRSAQLPSGPFGVNVQVATRQESAANQIRVWVAWPALQQEY